jgi:hypothetical protein
MTEELEETKMKSNNFTKAFTATLGLFLIFVSAATATAQVKRVQMHLGGYLCGN